MQWDIEFTDGLGDWWATLTEPEQESVNASIELLGEFGPNLRYPYSSGIITAKHDLPREPRIQHAGRPYRGCKPEPPKIRTENITDEISALYANPTRFSVPILPCFWWLEGTPSRTSDNTCFAISLKAPN